MATANAQADHLGLQQNGDRQNGPNHSAFSIKGESTNPCSSSNTPDSFASIMSSAPSDLEVSSGEYKHLQHKLNLSMGSEEDQVAGIFGGPALAEETTDKG